MNWVENRVKREAAIKLDGVSFWGKLATSINDAVESYNVHYGPEHGKVTCDPRGNAVCLARTINTATEPVKKIERQVSFDPMKASISVVGYQIDSRDMIAMDAEEDGTLILRLARNGDEITCDAASEETVKSFLFRR